MKRRNALKTLTGLGSLAVGGTQAFAKQEGKPLSVNTRIKPYRDVPDCHDGAEQSNW